MSAESYINDFKKYLRIEATIEQGKINPSNQAKFDQLTALGKRMSVARANLSPEDKKESRGLP